jgi:hypothetical protein
MVEEAAQVEAEETRVRFLRDNGYILLHNYGWIQPMASPEAWATVDRDQAARDLAALAARGPPPTTGLQPTALAPQAVPPGPPPGPAPADADGWQVPPPPARQPPHPSPRGREDAELGVTSAVPAPAELATTLEATLQEEPPPSTPVQSPRPFTPPFDTPESPYLFSSAPHLQQLPPPAHFWYTHTMAPPPVNYQEQPPPGIYQAPTSVPAPPTPDRWESRRRPPGVPMRPGGRATDTPKGDDETRTANNKHKKEKKDKKDREKGVEPRSERREREQRKSMDSMD